MDSFADLMFTDAVSAYQKVDGAFDKFQVMYRNRFKGDLDEDTRAFIEASSSFYIGSKNADGWPYVQHRGGPRGFVKLLGPSRIGFADYTGNHQFVTQGNLDGEDRVSLFFMDYPRQARLKMLGRATMTAASEDAELAEQLSVDGAAEAERLVVIDVAAMDWNCSKYIEPRYTEADIAAMLGPKIDALSKRNAELEAELATLKNSKGVS